MFEMDIENFSLLGHPSHHLARLRQPILSPHFLLCTIMGFMGDSLSDLVLCIVCCAQLLIASRYTPWMGGRGCASQHPVSVHFHVRSAPSHASWFWKNCLMGGGRRRLHGALVVWCPPAQHVLLSAAHCRDDAQGCGGRCASQHPMSLHCSPTCDKL